MAWPGPRLVLFFLNSLCLAGGCVLIVLGLFFFVHQQIVLPIDTAHFRFLVFAVIVIGFFLVCLFFLGCFGAMKSSNTMVRSYSVILTTLILLEIVLGSMVYYRKEQLDEALEKEIIEIFEKPRNSIQIDKIQQEFQCCGLHGPFEAANLSSCCPELTTSISKCTLLNAWKKNCIDAGSDYVHGLAFYLGLVAIIAGVLKLFTLISACFTIMRIRQEEEDYERHILVESLRRNMDFARYSYMSLA